MKKFHRFEESKRTGDIGEFVLDGCLCSRFEIHPVEKEQQFKGIDRYLRDKSGKWFAGKWFAVDYKTDEKSQRTGNVFIETVSSDVADTPGWVYKGAKVLVYYIPAYGEVYFVLMKRVLELLPEWQALYGFCNALNPEYSTRGVPVPLSVFKEYAFERMKIGVINEEDQITLQDIQQMVQDDLQKGMVRVEEIHYHLQKTEEWLRETEKWLHRLLNWFRGLRTEKKAKIRNADRQNGQTHLFH